MNLVNFKILQLEIRKKYCLFLITSFCLFYIWINVTQSYSIFVKPIILILAVTVYFYFSELKELFAAELHHVSLIHDLNSYADNSNYLNTYSSHVPTILSVLTAAFYPNIIKIVQGDISQGKMNKHNLVYSIM